MKTIRRFLMVPAAVMLVSCVSIEDIAIGAVADMLSSGGGAGSVFTTDEDPQLVSDALPFALKVYELVLGKSPDNPGLNIETGKNFVMYANAFIQTPAGMLSDDEWRTEKEMLERARKMYIRGSSYIGAGIELKHPGFSEALAAGDMNTVLSLFTAEEDASDLYWYASARVAALSCNPTDLEALMEAYKPAGLLLRALELDESFNKGAVHDVFIQLYTALPFSNILKAAESAPEITGAFINSYYSPEIMNAGPEALARFHFVRSVELSGGKNPGTYISLATSVSKKNQDYGEFTQLLEKALSISPEDDPGNSLVISIYREKAEWLLEHADDMIIPLDFQ